MSYQSTIQKLLHIKAIIDGLKALDTNHLTQAEREAVEESLDQGYDRAACFLAVVRTFEGKGTAKPILHSHCFAFFFWQRAYHMTSPLQGTRTNFLDANAKNWLRTHLAIEPLSHGHASLANKKAKK